MFLYLVHGRQGQGELPRPVCKRQDPLRPRDVHVQATQGREEQEEAPQEGP